MSNDNTVNIPLYEYRTLIRAGEQLNILIGTLLRTDQLNYNDTELRFDDTELNTILKALCPQEHKTRIEQILIERQSKLEEAK